VKERAHTQNASDPNRQLPAALRRHTTSSGNADNIRIYQDSKHTEIVNSVFQGGQTFVFSEYVSLEPSLPEAMISQCNICGGMVLLDEF